VTDRLEAAIRDLAAAIRAEVPSAVEPDAPVALLDVREAARRLGISRTTLYGEIGAGRVRSIKIGRRPIVPADALANYVRTLQD
jgi:excisionase family DNA binding protein